MSRHDPEKLGFLLTETARAWRTELDQRLRPVGLSQSKWTTLVHLARGAEKLTQREIAARIGIEEPTLAGLLDRLERDGWIKRKSASHDGRCKTVHLQKRAHSVLGRIFNTAQELRHELIEKISPNELQTCMSVLSKIRDRAEAVSQNGHSAPGKQRGKRMSPA